MSEPSHWVVKLGTGRYVAGLTAEPDGKLMDTDASGPMQVFQTFAQADHIAGIVGRGALAVRAKVEPER